MDEKYSRHHKDTCKQRYSWEMVIPVKKLYTSWSHDWCYAARAITIESTS